MGSWKSDSAALGRAEALRNLGLLIVDDEPNLLETLQEVFRRHFVVYAAKNAEAALAIVREHAPRLILSDQRMPGTTGTELLARIKELQPDTMRMLLTGYSDINVVIQALNDGLLYKYLTKPWEQQELVSTVLGAANQYLAGVDSHPSSFLGC